MSNVKKIILIICISIIIIAAVFFAGYFTCGYVKTGIINTLGQNLYTATDYAGQLESELADIKRENQSIKSEVDRLRIENNELKQLGNEAGSGIDDSIKYSDQLAEGIEFGKRIVDELRRREEEGKD